MIKTCYMCKHLATNENPDEWRWHGSDMTPPTPFKIFCKMGVWHYYEGPIDDLRKGLLNAHDCSLYEPLEMYATPQAPVEDYIGHLSRLPYCRSCGTNLLVKQQIIVDGHFTAAWKSFCPKCDDMWQLHPTMKGVYRLKEYA